MINRIINKLKSLFKNSYSYSYKGDFSSFEDAAKLCKGYAAKEVFEKTCETALKVKNGEFVFERDSVGFLELKYSSEVLEALQSIAKENNNQLQLTDFGGSLGSSYFQYRYFLESLQKISWKVIELPNIVKFGKENMEDGNLMFVSNLQIAEEKEKSAVLFSSSTFQYVSHPFHIVDEIIANEYPYILLDRIAFVNGNKHLLTIQETKEEIYEATYPAWFFNEQIFLKYFEDRGYKLKSDFKSYCDLPMVIDKKSTVYWKGFFFTKK